MPNTVPSEWSDDARLEAARLRRSAHRWNEQMASESSTFVGLLIDMYETATPVQLQVTHGRTHGGVLVEVGADFVAIAAPGQARVLLPFASIGAVQVGVGPRRLGAGSARSASSATTLAELIAQLAARPCSCPLNNSA